MAKLTLKFVDATRGVPIPGMDVEIQKIFDGNWEMISQHNSDVGGEIEVSEEDTSGDISGYYEAVTHVGNCFLEAGYALPALKFIDVLPIRFCIIERLDMLFSGIRITPYGYSFLGV